MAIETTLTMSGAIRDMYEKTFLSNLYPKLVWGDLAEKVEVEKGFGPTVQFRRYTPKRASDVRADASSASAPLVEGVTPSEQALVVESVTATAKEYGNYIIVSNWLLGNHISGYNRFVDDALAQLAKQGGEIMDNLIRDAALDPTGLNVSYASGQTAATFNSGTHVMTMADVRRVVRTLKGRLVPYFDNAHYVAVIGHYQSHDLQSEVGPGGWVDVNKYTGIKDIRNGEIGTMFGVRFIESPLVPTVTDANGVYSRIAFFGADTLKMVHVTEVTKGDRVEMKHIQLFIEPPGSAGSADPLHQRGTVGYRFNLAVKRVEDARLQALYAGNVD